MLGQSLAFAPAFTAAFMAAHRIFQILDEKMYVLSPEMTNCQRKPDKSGTISFKQVEFRYPTKPETPILRGINLEAIEGKTVALVGPSGCGKSTCIQLLQRLYDPDYGRIHLGLDEISRDISIQDLRSQLSIVSQEPTLFDLTIAENIAYGDNSRVVDVMEIIEAAKVANIHEFISSLQQVHSIQLL